MALFKVSKGTSQNLPSTLTEGYCWYTYDDSKFYIDFKDENGVLVRKAINAQDAETLCGKSLDEIKAEINVPDEIYVGNGAMPESATIQILMDGSDEEEALKDELKDYIDVQISKNVSEIVDETRIQEMIDTKFNSIVNGNEVAY